MGNQADIHTVHKKLMDKRISWQIQTTSRETQKILDVHLKKGKKSREEGGGIKSFCMC